MTKNELGQYFTPTWAAELLLQRHFPALSTADTLADLTCGDGRFLMAVPAEVGAFGVEMDPAVAAEARANTGREIVVGHFRQVSIPTRPTGVVGNPPFVTRVIDDLMGCCYEWLEYGGKVGLILPCYYFQYAERVQELSRRWTLAQELLPRNLFEGLKHPILFATFVKARRPFVTGFFLHAEREALQVMREEFRRRFVGNGSRANVWKETVQAALEICGGRASLSQLYACIENARPTTNPWWREKVRQIAARHFDRVGDAEYALPQGGI